MTEEAASSPRRRNSATAERQSQRVSTGRGLAAFKAVLLEGVEVVFIVIAVGGRQRYAVARRPRGRGRRGPGLGDRRQWRQASFPGSGERTEFVVGVMLSAFGLFWTGEGLGGQLAGPGLGHSGFRPAVPGCGRRTDCRGSPAIGENGMIQAVLKQIFGLFIDDPILAIGIFAIAVPARLPTA